MIENKETEVALYVVKGGNGMYFAGFDTEKRKANFVEDPKRAKKFTNKHDIKLRPDEMLVELLINLDQSAIKVSEPFRPHRKIVKPN